MSIRQLLSFVSLLHVCAACQIGGVTPLPIVGDAPQTMAIWPMAIGGEPPDDEVWFSGLAVALGRRGYRVMPAGITAQLLRSSDLADATSDEQALGRALRVDAILRLDVRRFDADGRSGLQHAEWDLQWRLLSTRGHGQQWSYEHHGLFHQAARASYDPGRSLDEQHQPRDIVPIGGSHLPSFRNTGELLMQLNNTAMLRLPKLELVERP